MTPKRQPQQLSLFQAQSMTVQQVAKLLRCSESSVKRLLERGDLHSYQRCTRGQRFILVSSLAEYEARLRKQYDLDQPLNGGN
jgi:excisionase family DNA binding protein